MTIDMVAAQASDSEIDALLILIALGRCDFADGKFGDADAFMADMGT